MLKIRRSRDRRIFNMGIPISGKDGLYIETEPCTTPKDSKVALFSNKYLAANENGDLCLHMYGIGCMWGFDFPTFEILPAVLAKVGMSSNYCLAPIVVSYILFK